MSATTFDRGVLEVFASVLLLRGIWISLADKLFDVLDLLLKQLVFISKSLKGVVVLVGYSLYSLNAFRH